MKNYNQQRYPCSILVCLDFGDGEREIDEIKGLNPGHALWRAIWNWPAAEKIERLPVGVQTFSPIHGKTIYSTAI